MQVMSLSGDTLVVLSGKEGQLIKLRPNSNSSSNSKQQYDLSPPFPTAARGVVVDEPRDQMFLAVQHRIDILNLSGGFLQGRLRARRVGNGGYGHRAHGG